MMRSLRNKIIFAFSLTNLAILIIAIVVFADLNYLRNQIVESEKVRDFLSTTQLLQNHEENLLLYHEPEAYFQLAEQLDQTRQQFLSFRQFFESIASTAELEKLDYSLSQYKDTLDELNDLDGVELLQMQNTIRTTSQSIATIIRDLGHRHHRSLSQAAQLVSWTLVIALSVVMLMGVISALFVSRQVVQPIRRLEQQLDAVADGKEKKLTLVSDDVEIHSFVQHFNTMLDKLRTQQSQLRHHEKAAALGVLVSGVAHELNNPLSNISTSVQLLQEDDGDDDRELRQQWLTHVDSETERARRIVRRLLDSVRQPQLNMQNLYADDIVRSAVLLIHRQLDPDVFLHIEEVPQTCIHVDRERLQQVFINLIRNAVDAGANNVWVFGDNTTWQESIPDDIERVQGKIASINEADELLLFTIADDGPGITDEHLTQLFTPFFTTKSGGEGTGLGLYLVEEIVDEHDGCITVENRPDGGTQFLIWLPVSEEHCEE